MTQRTTDRTNNVDYVFCTPDDFGRVTFQGHILQSAAQHSQ